MKLGIMQPYFCPYIGYFQLIHAVDKYLLYEHFLFSKNRWMNRNRIITKNRTPAFITIPLSKKSSNKKISEILIDNSFKWRKKLINTVLYNYKGSRFFNEVFPLINNLINFESDKLFEYNARIIIGISSFLDISTPIHFRNEKYLELEEQLRPLDSNDYSGLPDLESNKPIIKVARLIAICRSEGADTIINPIGGSTLYSKHEFNRYGIELKFLETKNYSYFQFSPEFHPNLSIIDLLMHNGREKTKKMLESYKLV